MTITAVLALFFLLAVSSGVFFLSQRIKVPYTVLLVAVGTFVLVPLSKLGMFDFVNDFPLTPELLFYIFLPILIFESAYNISIRHMMENIRSISLLAVLSLLISTVFIGFAMTFLFSLIGLEIPIIVSLLFGALISATDPVAVLALFKEFGAPRRLTLLFEGESIFNDGTAVALFLVVLEIARHGFEGVGSIVEGIVMFTMMVVGGILFGLMMGGIFAKFIGFARGSEFVQITLTIVLAHLTFIITDYISQNAVIGGVKIHLSAIIATTLAALVMGNYGRAKIPPRAEEFIDKFWGQTAFLANSLVFILIGLIFASLPFELSAFIVPVTLAIIVVAVGRALSIYPITAFMNWTRAEERIPRTWSHLLAWGSLRGALAITMVLLIPDDLIVAGWQYAFTPKEFILALTIGCIFATLFIKATTIKWLMDRLHIGDFTKIEKLELAEARALVQANALHRLNDFSHKGYVDSSIAEKLRTEHMLDYETAFNDSQAQMEGERHTLADRVMRMYAIGIERLYLKELYSYGEITEKVYKRIYGKLTIQHERIDHGTLDTDPSKYIDEKDIFERMANGIRRIFSPRDLVTTPEEQYMYYRAQSIIARKVLKEFAHLEEMKEDAVFGSEAFSRTKSLYEQFRINSQKKMEAIAEAHPDSVKMLSEKLARRGLLKVEENTLNELYERQMITPKIHIALMNEIEAEAEKLPELK